MKKFYFLLICAAAAVCCTPEDDVNPDDNNPPVEIPNPYEVENIADADDPTVNTLGESLTNKFGEEYTSTLKQVKVVGSINYADFASLLIFEEIDLSEVEVVGALPVFPGQDPQMGNAIPSMALLPNDGTQPTGANATLKKIILPSSVTTIGFCSLGMCSALTEVVMPKELKAIRAYAFRQSVALTTISDFVSCETIEDQAFDSCIALKDVVLPENLKTIGKAAFSGTAIEEITIPNSVETFGAAIFSVTKAMKKATLSSTMTEVPTQMFQGSAVAEVVIPEGIEAIASAAFCGTTALETVEIPSTLTKIGYKAFLESSIKSIDIPSTVEAIEYGAFYDCASLESVTVNWAKDAIPTIGEDPTGYGMEDEVFPSQFKDTKSIKVPAGTARAYEIIKGWAGYKFAE